jgi:hypothetical protein
MNLSETVEMDIRYIPRISNKHNEILPRGYPRLFLFKLIIINSYDNVTIYFKY